MDKLIIDGYYGLYWIMNQAMVLGNIFKHLVFNEIGLGVFLIGSCNQEFIGR